MDKNEKIKLVTNVINQLFDEPKKVKGIKEQWYKKGEKLLHGVIIVRAGYDHGQPRAIAYNPNDDEIIVLT